MVLTMEKAESTGHSQELRGRDILCFSHDWSGDPLSKTHLMRLLARDNRILWINSIGYRAPTASSRDLSRIVNKLKAATEMQGMTVIPLRIYFRNGIAKVEIALAQGKKSWDRRADERTKEARKEVEQSMYRNRRR